MIMKYLRFFAFGYFCLFFASCSSDLTQVYDIRSAVLYDVQKTQSGGNVRLAVYARLNRDAQESGFLEIKSPKADYIWIVEKPLYIHDTETGYVWIGSSALLPPPGSVFPGGRYVLIYTDESGKKTEAYFDIDDKRDFDGFNTDGYTKQTLGIFDKNGVLLGYRIEKTDITATEAAEQYPGAFFTRIIRLSVDGSRLLLKEPEFVSAESDLHNGGVR